MCFVNLSRKNFFFIIIDLVAKNCEFHWSGIKKPQILSSRRRIVENFFYKTSKNHKKCKFCRLPSRKIANSVYRLRKIENFVNLSQEKKNANFFSHLKIANFINWMRRMSNSIYQGRKNYIFRGLGTGKTTSFGDVGGQEK